MLDSNIHWHITFKSTFARSPAWLASSSALSCSLGEISPTWLEETASRKRCSAPILESPEWLKLSNERMIFLRLSFQARIDGARASSNRIRDQRSKLRNTAHVTPYKSSHGLASLPLGLIHHFLGLTTSSSSILPWRRKEHNFSNTLSFAEARVFLK